DLSRAHAHADCGALCTLEPLSLHSLLYRRWQLLAHSRKLAGGASAGPHLLWGGFCQGGAPRVLSIFSSFSFFVRPGQRFLRPDPHSEWPARAGAVKAGPRPLGGHRQAWAWWL